MKSSEDVLFWGSSEEGYLSYLETILIRLSDKDITLRSFLGLANYFRDHIRDHSIIVHQLHDMVKNYKPKQRLTWSQETKESFNDIKEAINARSKLFYVDDISPVYLQRMRVTTE